MMEWTSPQVKWVLSEFRHSQSTVGKFWTGTIIRGLYAAFRATTGLRVHRIPEYNSLLFSVGFRLQEREIASGGLLVSELWEYQEAIRGQPFQDISNTALPGVHEDVMRRALRIGAQ